jgi:hypothetical protein
MSRALVSIGYVLIVSGVLILTPLGDLLPVGPLSGLLSTSDEPVYQKIVATTASYTPTMILTGVGLIAVYLGKRAARSKEV